MAETLSQLTSIYNAIITGIQALNNLNQTLALVVPAQTVTISPPSSVGALTFTSSEPTAFLILSTSSGGTYRVPAYNNF